MEKKLRKYGNWAGNPKGVLEDETRCIESLWGRSHSHGGSQCSRKRGYGPDGLHCKQHDPDRIAKSRKETDEARHKCCEREKAKHLRTRKALELIEGIPTEELSDYRVVRIEK